MPGSLEIRTKSCLRVFFVSCHMFLVPWNASSCGSPWVPILWNKAFQPSHFVELLESEQHAIWMKKKTIGSLSSLEAPWEAGCWWMSWQWWMSPVASTCSEVGKTWLQVCEEGQTWGSNWPLLSCLVHSYKGRLGGSDSRSTWIRLEVTWLFSHRVTRNFPRTLVCHLFLMRPRPCPLQ